MIESLSLYHELFCLLSVVFIVFLTLCIGLFHLNRHTPPLDDRVDNCLAGYLISFVQGGQTLILMKGRDNFGCV